MDQFSAQRFSKRNTNPSTSTRRRRTSSSTSNMISFAQRNMHGYPENFYFTGNPGLFNIPQPYPDPYNQNLQIQNMHSILQMDQFRSYGVQTRRSSVGYGMSNNNSEPQRCQSPQKENSITFKANRDNRLQVLRQSRNSAPYSVPEGILIREQRFFNTIVKENRNTNNPFRTPDGKMLEEILTKDLKYSDICSLGRIVLPKREAEKNLPALRCKGGMDLVFQDVSSDELLWVFKYKFWINNKSRMYVLENTGNFVKHYGLQSKDSVTLYTDEFKALYVGSEKARKYEEVSEPVPNMEMSQTLNYSDIMVHEEAIGEQQPETYLPPSTKENNNKEAEAASSIFTASYDGASSSATKSDEIAAQLDQLPNKAVEEGGPSQAAPTAAAASTVDDEQKLSNNELEERLEEFFETLDMDIFQPGHNYPGGFDHFTDLNMWP